ncbi:hemin uptake protein HemP [Hyphomicrobium sp.]|uniref:hemin uptake protein HemP n=1 Tax=Hyphomicrobium sp. TaxID=82 RepID=UPI003F720E7C
MSGDDDNHNSGQRVVQPSRAVTIVRHKVSDLMRGGREAVLEHDGADYHLRITANGRLILTK